MNRKEPFNFDDDQLRQIVIFIKEEIRKREKVMTQLDKEKVKILEAKRTELENYLDELEQKLSQYLNDEQMLQWKEEIRKRAPESIEDQGQKMKLLRAKRLELENSLNEIKKRLSRYLNGDSAF